MGTVGKYPKNDGLKSSIGYCGKWKHDQTKVILERAKSGELTAEQALKKIMGIGRIVEICDEGAKNYTKSTESALQQRRQRKIAAAHHKRAVTRAEDPSTPTAGILAS